MNYKAECVDDSYESPGKNVVFSKQQILVVLRIFIYHISTKKNSQSIYVAAASAEYGGLGGHRA